MRCPIDNETLVMADRHGIEIDYCPKCRGVWLDRCELDKIIERSQAAVEPSPRQTADNDQHRSRDRYPKKKRRESLLSELFDF